MPNGDVRRSKSANIFKVTRRNKENTNQHPKRLCEETLATASEILEEAAATLIEETVNINPNLLTTQNHYQKTSYKQG